MAKYDLIVIGAGHNGLITGARLAKSGLKTLVLEKASLVGGLTRTDPNIFPGYNIDIGSQKIGHSVARIAKELNLEQFGFEIIEIQNPIMRYFLGDDIDIPVYRDLDATCQEIAKYSKEEADNYRRVCQDWAPFSRMLSEVFSWTEPSYAQLFTVLESLGPKAMRLYLGKASDILRSYFSTDWMGGIARIVWATGINVAHPGTGYSTQYLPRVHWSPRLRAKGGMQGLVNPLAKVIEHYGGEVRLNAGVRQVIIEDGQAKGVRLESGEEITGSIIVSATHVKTTYLNLVGEENLEPHFAEFIKGLAEGNAIETIVLILDESFPIECDEIAMCYGLTHIEEITEARVKGKTPARPCLYVENPCPYDPSLAPPGGTYIFVADIVAYHLEGTTWEAEKEKHAELMIDTLDRRIPGLKRCIVNRHISSPLDYERNFNLWEGSMIGTAPTFDQLYSMRPAYRTPIKELYITGQCTHPAGGVIGIPGYNTATLIMQDLERGIIKT